MSSTASDEDGAVTATDLFEQAHGLAVAGEDDRALARYDELDRAHAASTDPAVQAVVAAGLLEKAEVLDRVGRGDDEVEAYAEVIGRYRVEGAPAVRQQVARARFNTAATVVASGRIDEATALLTDLVAEYGGDDSVEVLEVVGRALCELGFLDAHQGRTDESLRTLDGAVERFGRVAEPTLRVWAVRATSAACQILTLHGDAAAAERRYDELTSRYGHDESASVRGEAAGALVTRALVIADRGSRDEARRAFAHVVTQHGADTAPEVAYVVCRACWEEAQRYLAVDDLTGALPVLNTIRQDYTGSPDPGIRDIAITALLSFGTVLAELGRKEEAIEVYQRCRDEVRASGGREATAAYAAFREAGALISLDRQEDAALLLDDLLVTYRGLEGDAAEVLLAAESTLGLITAEHFGADAGSAVLAKVAGAADGDEQLGRFALGARWHQARLLEGARPLEAAAVYDEIITQHLTGEAVGWDDVLSAKLAVFSARADAFRAGGGTDAELRAYDALIDEFADNPDPSAQREVALTKANKALTLLHLGRHAESASLCDEVIGRHHAGLVGGSPATVAHAMFTKATALRESGQAEAALSAFDAPASLPPDDGLEVARWSARAALARAELLAELHRWDEVIATCAGVAQRYGDRFEQELREYCAAALCAEGEARAQLGDADAAISLWTQLVTTYRRDTTTEAHELVARALHAAAQAHEAAGRPDAAARVHRDLVDSYSHHPSEDIAALVTSSERYLAASGGSTSSEA